jgi:hypothetical protein
MSRVGSRSCPARGEGRGGGGDPFAAGERHPSPLDLAALERLIQRPS